MKTFKKFAALLIAALMVVLSVSALAADGDFTGTAEDEIIATGLATGDTVTAIKIIEWDATTSNWKFVNGFSATLNGTALTIADLVNGISAEEGAAIADAAKSMSGTTMTETETAGTYHATGVAPGLYYVKAVSQDPDTIYNAAFVSADYYEGGNSVAFSTEASSVTYVKKSTLTFKKEVTGTEKYVDTKPGDEIPYQITTTIPAYGANYTNAKFEISDTLSAGLTLKDTAVSVKYGDTTVTTSNDDVTITPSASGFTVAFAKTYLQSLSAVGPVDVTVTYAAVVDDPPLESNVVALDNKAKLTYSHSPNEDKDKEDLTRHYYYTIDGDVLGKTGEEGSELIKTGTDAQGNILTSNRKTYHENPVSALDGATFKLVGADGYEATATSTNGGHIRFTGLKAGTYTLTEETAPAGFVRDTRTFTVVITPTYNADDSNSATYDDLLSQYTVSITADGYNGSATFTVSNQGGITKSSSIESSSNFINNTQGTELPSTGGMGTTILYTVGGILVLGAVIVMITRRRVRG